MLDDLRRIRLFAGLDAPTLDSLSRHLRPRAIRADELVIQEGRDEGRCYFVARGTLRVSSSLHHLDQEEVYSFLRQGDHFGEISLVDRRPPSANVVAEEDGMLYEMSHEDLRQLMDEDPAAANRILWAMLEGFCARLRETNQSLSFARFLMKRPGAAG